MYGILDLTKYKNVSWDSSERNRLYSKVICGKDLQHLNVGLNWIETIKLNDTLKILICEYNKLTSLKCNEQLNYLNCSYNKLTELELNYNLRTLDCAYNSLKTIKYIPSTLSLIFCKGNQFDFETELRLIKHHFENKGFVDILEQGIENYKKYLILLLGLNTYIIKYL